MFDENESGPNGLPSRTCQMGLASRPDHSPWPTRPHPAADENRPGSASLARQGARHPTPFSDPRKRAIQRLELKGSIGGADPLRDLHNVHGQARAGWGCCAGGTASLPRREAPARRPQRQAGQARWVQLEGMAEVRGMDNMLRRKQRPALADLTGEEHPLTADHHCLRTHADPAIAME